MLLVNAGLTYACVIASHTLSAVAVVAASGVAAESALYALVGLLPICQVLPFFLAEFVFV